MQKVSLKTSPWENERMKGLRLRNKDKLGYMMLIAIAQDTLCLLGGGVVELTQDVIMGGDWK